MPDPLSSPEVTASPAGDPQPASGLSTDPSPELRGDTVPDPETRPYTPPDVARYQPVWVPIATRRVRNRVWLHALLFLATVLTTTLIGIGHWLSWMADYRVIRALPPLSVIFTKGFWYSATILTILGAHELGHYFACRYYRIDASLPYFIPLPPPFPLTGTLGAFIRIRQPVTTKRALFDIGVAGPLAGFFFAVPALFIGVALSHVARVPARTPVEMLELGEPLLFKLAAWSVWGQIPDGYSLNLHPIAFAAWFGLLATALNLFPIGQLDGGHISYTVFGRRSTYVTMAMMGVAVVLAFFSLSLVLWTVLMVAMLLAFGPHHPPVMDERVPLSRGRQWLAALALLIFILCFTPAPIQPLDLLK
jgi:membrane-associated protease RseP (regulator of RpoE activity)